MNQSNITKTLLILSLLAAFMGFALPATAASTPPATAASTPVCGNGTLELEAGEICDEGSTSGDICTNNCKDLKEGWVCNLQRLCKENEVIDDGEACGDNTQNSCEECSEVINLGSWTKETYPLQGSLFSAEWGVHKGDLQVTLKTNQNTFKDDPNNSGFFILKDEPLLRPGEDRRVIELKLNNIHPTVKTDDDYIGVAFGIREGDVGDKLGNKEGRGLGTADPEGPADFILLQWKDSSQFEGKANEFGKLCFDNNAPDPQGISLAHIRGIVTWNELWTRPTTPCKDNKKGSFTLLDKSDPRVNDDARIPYVSERVNPPAPPLPRGNRAKPEVFATLRVIYSKTRIQVFVDKFSNGNYKRVIDQPGKFPTHGNIGLFAMAQNAMTFTFLRPTENNIAVCRPERCGDGYVATTTASGILSDIAEQCDDGNTLPNDGCDPLCQKETCDDKTTGGCKDGEIQKGWACSTKEGGKCFKVTLDTIPHNGEELKDSDKDKEEKYTYYTRNGDIEIGGSLTGDLSEVKVSVQKKDEQGNNVDLPICTSKITPSSSSVKQWATSTCNLSKSEGTYIVTVTGIAEDGTEQVIKRKVVYESTAPKATIAKLTEKDSSKELTNKTGEKINKKDPDIFFDVPDQDTKSLVVDIKKKDGSTIKENIPVTKGTDGKWKLSTSEQGINLEDDNYIIEVEGTDYAGNKQDPKETFVFTVDTKAPKVTVSKLTENNKSNTELTDKADEKINKKNPVIFFNVQDDGDLGSVKVTIKKEDGSTIKENIPVTKGNDGNWKLGTDNLNLKDGKYTIEVTGTDDVGNHKTNTFAFEVDTTAPEPKLTKKKTNESLRPTLTLKTDPDTKDISNVKFTPKNRGLSIIIGTASRNPDTGKWEVTPNKPLTEGTEYDVAVDAEDNVGNKTTAHDAGTITVDQTPPNPATVKKLTKKGEDTTLTNTSGGTIKEKNPDIFFDVPQEDDTESLIVTITKKDGTKVQEENVTKGADGSWKLPTDNLENGEYTIEVVAVDEAGNRAQSQTFGLKVALEDPNSSGYVLGGCSTTPTTPAEGLLPLLLSALGVGFLRRRKK